MNLGQLPLVVGAFAILATLQLSVNSSIVRSFTSSWEDEATIDAMAIGQAMIDEAMTKSFDKNTVGKKVYAVSELVPTGSFGADSGETVTAYEQEPFQSQVVFNDFDDYHRYTRIVSSPRLGDFTVRDSIIYVQETNKDLYSSSSTWFKKIIVTVNNPLLPSPVVQKSLIVYRRYF